MEVNLFNEVISDVSEYDLLVLRGHLVVEEHLNKLLKILAVNSKFILKNQVKFSVKLAIVRAFVKDGSVIVWDLIDAINKLRNHIAHDLPYKRDQKKIDKILSHPLIKKQIEEQHFKRDLDLSKKQGEHLQLSLSFMYLFGFLVGKIEALKRDKGD